MDDYLKTLVAEIGSGAQPSARLSIQRRRTSRESIELLEGLGDRRAQIEHPEPLIFAEPIARGGMGVIRRATQVSVGRDVAVKSVRDELASDATSMELLREAWITGALEHPNIVPVHDILLGNEKQPLVVLKHIVGQSWSELIADEATVVERFGAADLVSWNLEVLLSVTNAIRYAHSNRIVHRDIKPENVMIGDFGEVYVVDWGLAISLDPDPDGRYPTIDPDNPPIAGTPRYMAPEMLGGPGARISERTDVFLLGASLFQVIAGEPPNRGASMPEVFEAIAEREPAWPDGPRMLVSICKRALAKDPADRYASVDEFHAALQAYELHRASSRLSDDAYEQLGNLRRAIDVGSDDGQINDRFAECRFGFRAALRSWPENRAARAGLLEAVTAVVEHDLERGAAGAAKARLSGLLDPPAALVARIDAALTRHGEREARLTSLERDLDPSEGNAIRRAILVGLAVVWAFSPLLHLKLLSTRGAGPWSPWLSIGLAVVFLGLIGGLGILLRDGIARSHYNRKLYLALLLTPIASIINGVGGFLAGSAADATQTNVLLVWMCIAGSYTILVEWRFLPAAVGYLVGYAIASANPEMRFFAMTAGHLITAVTAAVIWRPGGQTSEVNGPARRAS